MESYVMSRPGIYEMPAIEYHKDPCLYPSLSASIAHILLTQTPEAAKNQHPRLNKTFQPKFKNEFDLGSAAHAIILEGNEKAIQVIDAEDWRKKETQQARDAARAEGKYPLLANRLKDVRAMVEKFWAKIEKNELIYKAMKNGKPEQTICWKEGKLYMRSRIDWLPNDRGVIIDYKTTENANRETFVRGPLVSQGYDMKGAFYLRGLSAIDGIKRDIPFIWIVQETSPPFDLSFVGMGNQMREVANRKVETAIKIWSECTSKDEWPGYSSEIFWAELPPFAVQRFEEFEMFNEMGVI